MPDANDTTNPDTRPKTAGRGLYDLYQSAARLDYLIDLAEGEITPEVETAEREFLADESAALDALIDYRSYSDRMVEAAKVEAERAAEVAKRYADRKAWCDEKLRGIVERRVEGTKKRSITHGTHKIALRKSPEFVAADDDLDLESLPPFLITYTDPKPPEAKLDKKAAKEALRSGEDIPGLRLARRADRLEVK